jgi:quercetin dioxygenase-like cupin family protein
VLGYVLEGQMRFAINHEQERVLPTAATFFEPSGAVHTTSGSARTDGPTRALVFMLVPKGAPLTAPA